MAKKAQNGEMKERKISRVEVKGKVFCDVKNIRKFNQKCMASKLRCKYYSTCYSEGVFRVFDCRKNAEIVSAFYAFFTAVAIAVFTIAVFKFFELSIFKSVALIIFATVVFDIFCTVLEWSISITRKNLLYLKLNRMEKKKLKQEEKEKLLKQQNGRIENLYHDDIESAKVALNALKTLSKKLKIAKSENISEVIFELSEILEKVSEEPNKYLSVAYIFEVRLPNFYNLLGTYESLLSMEKGSEAHQAVLKGFKSSTEKFLLEVREKGKSI